jgi:hypothetical protein
MALGYPIGHSARITQNNHTLYMIGYGGRQVHIALMGDPTLKLYVVRPPTDLALTESAVDGIHLTWRTPADSVVGYHVYRSETIAGDFFRLSSDVIADTAFVDGVPLAGQNVYMVRAVKLETSASGTYFNLSPGAIDSLDARAGVAPPARGAILGTAPNPSLGATEITFDVAARGRVGLRIYDAAGRLVRTVEGGRRDPGRHTLAWDGRDAEGRGVAAGVYFLAVTTGRSTLSSKVVKVQ